MSPGSRLIYWVAKLVFLAAGWHVDAHLLNLPKYVLIAAPHTSNWDGILGVVAEAIITRGFSTLKVSFLAKRSLFRWPLTGLIRWAGGLPVDRSARHAAVDQAICAFKESQGLVLAITPEGSRKRTPHWKTGFYYIALGAGVPILCVYIDYKRRVVGTGPTIVPSGDIHADMAQIRDFYRSVVARHPERVGEITVAPR